MKPIYNYKFLPVFFLLLIFNPLRSTAYSVLSHEAVVDASWKKSILPLLKERYPMATDSELRVAHSYAYGGCMMPDMGYFPFGAEYFTNLAHYVRTGDFVSALLSESQNLNEFAFSLGALCHYVADKYGHSLGTNHVVPLVYPKLKAQYGDIVTYEENPMAHSRVEISFDVLQVARGNYASPEYHDFIGFNVDTAVLERAFVKTYGEDINTVFGDFPLAVGTFRWSVRSLLPTLTRAAWVLRKSDIKKTNPSANSRSFHYKMRRRDYYAEFGKKYQRPGFKAQLIAFLIRILPKVGPLRAFKFKDPGPQGEKLFIASFDSVLVHYSDALAELRHKRVLTLPNIDYDTGKPTTMGEYGLADKTYGQLVQKLQDNKFFDLSRPLKQNILSFYNTADTAKLAQKDSSDWKKTYAALQLVKNTPPVRIDSLKNSKGVNYKLLQ
jgi:hypothetical protein